jgi:hypothetical protein
MIGQRRNIPKSHHFVAQMHSERFADQEEKLWAFNKGSANLFHAPPKAVFTETHLYTIESPDGVKDTSLEVDFSRLEGEANLIIEKLVIAARSGEPPELTEGDRVTWDTYFYLQWKRVPDVHNKVASLAEANTWLSDFFAQVRNRGPEAAARANALDTPAERKRLIQEAKVHSIRKTPGRVLEALGSRGLAVLHVTAPGESFAIGSLPIVRMQGDLRRADSETWLPVASDVAVGPGFAPGTVTFIPLTDAAQIWRMNMVTAKQSMTFAAASKELVERLVANLPNK